MLATARRAPENLRLGGVQLQMVHPVADCRNALRHTALKFVCSSWLTEPVYLGIIRIKVRIKVIRLYELHQVSCIEKEEDGSKDRPCGTPHSINEGVDLELAQRTNCVR